MKKILIYTDGGARGNPGPAACGVYITDSDSNVLARLGISLGIATNNVAEYQGVLHALSWLLENPSATKDIIGISFFLDSQLVCRQLLGEYKVKDANLQGLYYQALEKQRKLSIPIHFSHIPREQNKNADLLVNQALDAAVK